MAKPSKSSIRKWTHRPRHILDAIHRIRRYTAGLTLEEFAANEMAVDAVVRNFQIIGEAARHIPPDVEAAHNEIPWPLMRKMRHVLVHDYDVVRLDVVWSTIQNDLPPLIAPLQNLLAAIQQSSSASSTDVQE